MGGGYKRSMGQVRATDNEWSWKRLLASDTAVRDTAWMARVAALWKAGEVPVEHKEQVLQVGVDRWQPSMQQGMTTFKMAPLLRQGLGVSFVASDMQKYKDAVLFRLTMACGVEIQSFDLPWEHSQVSFAMLALLTNAADKATCRQKGTQAREQQNAGKVPDGRQSPAGARVPMREDDVDAEEGDGYDDGEEANLRYPPLSKQRLCPSNTLALVPSFFCTVDFGGAFFYSLYGVPCLLLNTVVLRCTTFIFCVKAAVLAKRAFLACVASWFGIVHRVWDKPTLALVLHAVHWCRKSRCCHSSLSQRCRLFGN